MRMALVLGLLAASDGMAAPDQGPDLHRLQVRELEVKVWTADEHELPSLEREVVRLMQIDPRSPDAHHLLSHVQSRLFAKDPGDLYLLKQASDLAQQAVDLDPRSPMGYVALADILDLMGNADRGLRLLDEAEAAGLEPDWRFYFTRARLLSSETSTAKALGLLETALGFVDSEPRIIVPYVVAILQSEANGEALVAKLADWNARHPSPLFKLTMAITYGEIEQHRKAHQLYTEILKVDPANREARVNDAVILYRDLKDGKKAAEQLERVLSDDSENMTPPVRGMVTAHLGAAYLASKSFDRAEDRFTEAVGIDQSDGSILDFVTREYREKKQHARLVSLIRRLNDNVRGMGVLHALLGETLSENLDRHDDALKAFADAITLEPSRSDFYNGMGLAYYRKKSYGDALKQFAVATEVDPNDATARYNEACVLALLGRSEESIATLAEALSLDPRLVRTAREDKDFAGIRSTLKFQELVQDAESPADESLEVLGH